MKSYAKKTLTLHICEKRFKMSNGTCFLQNFAQYHLINYCFSKIKLSHCTVLKLQFYIKTLRVSQDETKFWAQTLIQT